VVVVIGYTGLGVSEEICTLSLPSMSSHFLNVMVGVYVLQSI
jgi:hypothetical protein